MTTKTEAASQVRKVLQEVKDRIAQPGGLKVNEATTRAHFINPLLGALGYSAIEDIDFEHYLPDGKQFLDYRLKVDGNYRVSVEAKALDVSLNDSHGAQVIQYSSVLGDEWAVVTNARQWRLYHAFVKGGLADKLVQSVDLIGWESDQQFAAVFEQLWLVSSEAFEASDGPASWLNKQRIDQVLGRVLADPASSEVKYLRKRLLDQGISTSAEEVALWFKARLEAQPASPKPAPAPVAVPATAPIASPAASPNTASKVVGVAPGAPQVPAKKRVGDAPLCFLTPVKDEPEATVEETLHSLLDQGVYVFGDRTAGRAVLREGDRICFYHSRVGVVAHAKIASVASKRSVPFVKSPDRYPWAFAVSDVRYYLDNPVPIDLALRAQLDGFTGKDPASDWGWFVQGTGYVTPHDFALLTRS